jgi:hypothetical protein
MYKIIDNFLTDDDFNLFSDAALKSSSSYWGASTKSKNFDYWTKSVTRNPSKDFEKNVNSVFGSIVYKVSNLIKLKLQEEIESLPPVNAVTFMFQQYPYIVQNHLDRVYAGSDKFNQEFLKDTHTAFFYAHKHWDTAWGGELCFTTHNVKIEPKPNRLVYYSSDELHLVTQVTNTEKNIRKVFQVDFIPINKTQFLFCNQKTNGELV